MEPPQLRCWPELCLPLEATPEPRMVTGPPCPLLHLEAPVVPPPPSPPRSSCLPPSLPPAPSQSWIHTLSPKADFKLPNSGGEPPTKGVGFPEARFPSKVPLTVAGLGRSFLGSQLTPYRGQALCPSPAALCSDSVWGPESTGEGGPPRRSGHQRALLPRALLLASTRRGPRGAVCLRGCGGSFFLCLPRGVRLPPPSEECSPVGPPGRSAGLHVQALSVWRCWEEWLGSLQVGMQRSRGAWGRAAGGRGWRPPGQGGSRVRCPEG